MTKKRIVLIALSFFTIGVYATFYQPYASNKLFGETRVKLHGVGIEFYTDAISSLPGRSVDFEFVEGNEQSDVQFVILVNWKQIEEVSGAKEDCGTPCAIDSNNWFVRKLDSFNAFPKRKSVFLNIKNIIKIDSDTQTATMDEEDLSCLIQFIYDEIRYRRGNREVQECRKSLGGDLNTSTTTTAFGFGWP